MNNPHSRFMQQTADQAPPDPAGEPAGLGSYIEVRTTRLNFALTPQEPPEPVAPRLRLKLLPLPNELPPEKLTPTPPPNSRVSVPRQPWPKS